MSFWLMAYLTFGLISIAEESPIPLVIVFTTWLLSRPLEAPLVAEVERTGGHPDAIPNPVKGRYGCAAFIVWLLVFGSMAIVALAALVAIVGGKSP